MTTITLDENNKFRELKSFFLSLDKFPELKRYKKLKLVNKKREVKIEFAIKVKKFCLKTVIQLLFKIEE